MLRNEPDSSPIQDARWLIVGNPACRRVARFQKSLAEQGKKPARLLGYPELLDGHGLSPDGLRTGDLVRLESAAEKWSTRRALLGYGYELAQQEGYAAIAPAQLPDELAADVPEIKPRQLYLGFRRLLGELESMLTDAGAISIQSPADVACMFDKWDCQTRLQRSGVAIPELLAQPRSYDELRSICGESGRYLLKMAHGSGGVGCVAIHVSRGRIRAFVSSQTMRMAAAEHAEIKIPVQKIDDELILAKVVDSLCRESAHLERWLPKDRFQGRPYDLRVVVIAGKPRHAIARLGSSPFTNLNLGGQRRSMEQMASRITPDCWEKIERIAAQVADCFPETLCFGLDLLRTPGGELAVIEVNAFGDFLLNVFQDGLDPYAAEIVAAEDWANRHLARLAQPAELA
ncbi:STM4014 family protein [Blastopirellula marina]|uniref:ATP-grasp domain-containing protein n=1 Tax=Blastopirellula marina TaxID=124 RepID=A0A2S8FD88_9BACT|nr:STM4014 family protein [Blastopirellula marina]PQO30133.1 hypothetical protein C5Y98_21525 [Blastopirellula marina]PQO43185.1 hypothetical protein C5Y93_26140 [Blastopirellula marina]PTL42571.1 hypothetical protein C5Y97_21535 [Blastopirellula marina]